MRRRLRRILRDYSKYDVLVDGVVARSQRKRNAVYRAFEALCDNGITPEQAAGATPYDG